MVERRLVDGTIDFFIGPLRNSVVAPGLSQEKLFDNHRVVIARKHHPLQHATSLADLADSDWITNDPEAEFNDLFLSHGLPPPRPTLRTETFLTMLIGA